MQIKNTTLCSFKRNYMQSFNGYWGGQKKLHANEKDLLKSVYPPQRGVECVNFFRTIGDLLSLAHVLLTLNLTSSWGENTVMCFLGSLQLTKHYWTISIQFQSQSNHVAQRKIFSSFLVKWKWQHLHGNHYQKTVSVVNISTHNTIQAPLTVAVWILCLRS